MTEEQAFRELIRQVRDGDENAAAELVRQYEPEIRRAVRVRLTDPQMQRLFDSMDICQSVLANFFDRVTQGQFDLREPGQLLRLLVTMARHKLVDEARMQQAGRRDLRRTAGNPCRLESVAATDGTPSQIVADQELAEQLRANLSDEERYLADQRVLGRDWAEIAAELGCNAEALRKKLARAIERVTRQLGMEMH
jgi:RNA polymerase sigma-70 factor (ECF subfamily)